MTIGRSCYAGMGPTEQALFQWGFAPECVAHGSGRVVIWFGLNLSAACTGSGATWEGQGQPPPVPYLGLLDMSHKGICGWLLLVLGLEVPRRAQVKCCPILISLFSSPFPLKEALALSRQPKYLEGYLHRRVTVIHLVSSQVISRKKIKSRVRHSGSILYNL